MKNFRARLTTYLLSILIFVFVTACSSDDDDKRSSLSGPSYSGSASPAEISASNTQAIGVSATDATTKAINSETAQNASPFGVVNSDSGVIPTEEMAQQLNDLAVNIIANMVVLPSAITINYDQLGDPNYCGGSVTIPEIPNSGSTSLDLTMTFNNLCYNDGINPEVILNGSMRVITSESENTIIFKNFSVTSNGKTETISDATFTCTATECSIDFEGSDGRVYRFQDLAVTGDDSSGYEISGTFFHPDHGSVLLETTQPITFNCPDAPQPGSGELTFAGTNDTTGSISFVSCSEYTYCYDTADIAPVCETGNW